VWIEQAIFTSRQGPTRDGYQLTATSPGLAPEDARALSQWGPAHDSLRKTAPFAESIQFHPLPSGRWCIAQTNCRGAEYSGRGGNCIFTHSLVVPGDILCRFAFHPFQVLDAVNAAGNRLDPQAERLPQLTLCGRGSPTSPSRLALLANSPGYGRLVELLRAVLGPSPVAAVTRQPARSVLRGLFDLVPLEQRHLVSFSTDLRFSPRRPFHLLGLEAAEPGECRKVARAGMTVVDLSRPSIRGVDSDEQPLAGETSDCWPRQVLELLLAGQLHRLDDLLQDRLAGAVAQPE
jgi:hypothetical protein